MPEPSWLVILLLSVILSIPIGVLINLATPHIQDWLAQYSLSSRGKKLKRLEQEYARVKSLRDEPMQLGLDLAKAIIRAFIMLMGAIMIFVCAQIIPFIPSLPIIVDLEKYYDASPWISSAIVTVLFLVGFSASGTLSRLQALLSDLNRLCEFERYEAATLAEIDRLQAERASPEETQEEQQEEQEESIQLIILDATYGALIYWTDVTQTLRSCVSNGRIDIVVNFESMGVDPIKGTSKKLKVNYLYRGQQLSKEVDERSRLILP